MTEVITLLKCGLCSFEFKRPHVEYYHSSSGQVACYTCPRCKQPQQAAVDPPMSNTVPKFDISAAVANVQLPAINTLARNIAITGAGTMVSTSNATSTFHTLTVPQHITHIEESPVQLPIQPLPPQQVLGSTGSQLVNFQALKQVQTAQRRPPPEVFMSLNPVQVTNQIHPSMQQQHHVIQSQHGVQPQQSGRGSGKSKRKGGPRAPRPSLSGKEKKFSCQFCDFKSTTNFNVSAHVKSVHCKIKDFSCDRCDFKSSKKWNLKSHIKTVHDKLKDFSCNLCDYKSSRKDALMKHFNDVHQKIKVHS